ncbi:glycosyl hydrolases family 31-domain-containing protein [Myxozyma melibiosi]|uniref:Glycosyl hydrolases family 31-domain-containing protein n=1 Tax=Myxozyma melibiosi TaxID=54550 RepID=A0ABR1F3Z9_9ASCO
MVRISQGMWEPTPDTVIDWASEVVKTVVEPNQIYALTAAKPIVRRGDTLNTSTLSHTISSPAEGIVHLSTVHHAGHKSAESGPEFEIFPDGKPDFTPKVVESAESATLVSGDLTATLDTRPASFNLSFTAPDKDGDSTLVTQLGFRSVGYIRIGNNVRAKQSYMDPFRGERYVTYQFDVDVNEKIYGLGERFGPLLKNGQYVEMWNEDGGTTSDIAYKNIPFYMTSKGYGVFIPSPGLVQYEIQSERNVRVNISLPGEKLSAYLIYGPSPKQVVERYALLTGKPALPPTYSFGLWLSTSFTTTYDKDTVLSFVDGMTERGIKVSVFHYDCFWMKRFQWCDFEFDSELFPDPAADMKALANRGAHVCVWINPYVAQESALFKEGKEKGYFIKRTDGSVWQHDFWQAGQAFVDFTNPAACKWFQSKISALIDLGVHAFKTDFGERIPVGDAVYYDGSDPEKMHNYYTFLYNKVTFEIIEKKLGHGKACLFARSATAGGQRFPVHWGGDPQSTFGAMAESLRGGLSLSVAAFGFWAHDIGGFEGKPDPVLYKRWIAFGLLSSHSRLHGSGTYRVPWVLDPSGESDVVLKRFVEFKHTLMPYIILQALQAHRSGISMMRNTFMEFPDDPVVWSLDTQYFFGSEILVAPVFNHKGTVTYYVPRTETNTGKWYGLLDGGKLREGGRYHTEKHDFLSLPALLRPGGVLAFGKSDEQVEYDWASGITLLINASEPVKKQIPIANYKNVNGPDKVVIDVEVTGSVPMAKLNVEVCEGKMSEDWNIKIVCVNVATSDNTDVEILSDGDQKIIKVPAKVKKMTFSLN